MMINAMRMPRPLGPTFGVRGHSAISGLSCGIALVSLSSPGADVLSEDTTAGAPEEVHRQIVECSFCRVASAPVDVFKRLSLSECEFGIRPVAL